MNALEKLVDVLIAVVLLFFLPILYYGSGKQVSGVILAGQAGENFLNRISTAGEITLPVWNELEDTLENFGCDRFELSRERYLFEPDRETGGVVRRLYVESAETLLEQMQEKDRTCLLKGDCIKLTIYYNEVPMLYYDYVRTGATEQ